MKMLEIKEKVSPVLRAHGVKRASVFGSVSRGEDHPDSDIDLLIELGNKPMGMFAYMELIDQLETNLGRKIDLITEGGSSKFLKPYILPDLTTIYEG